MKNLLLLPFLVLLSISFLTAQSTDDPFFGDMKPRNIGPAGMSGRINTIDVNLSNPDEIFIGSASGGVWKSSNGGTSWSPIFQNEETAAVGALAIDQNNPNIIWVGTGEGNPRNSLSGGFGLYKSIDGGRTWKHLGLEKTRHIHRIILHPTDPNVAWLGVIGSPWGEHSERGVYKTVDGGKTFKKVLFVDNKTGAADLIFDPHNPNKLVAAMWEHRRYPWYFNSGGKGSGLYTSYDGGETWAKKTEGLPKGELGRIGLTFAPTKKDLIYAIVEAKKNGFYQSTDGGESWKLVSSKGIGGRPFYYADIFTDTKNENRIYNIHTTADVSHDGGKTFERFIPTSLIHVDNHAWWQHPEDPSFIINGNDGGLAITRDGGETWDFPENLPIGQFYHIRTDMAVPYNVYGGMQDNGSWRGPSQVWRRKGIRNLYWNRIGFGDGFDALPDPKSDRHGYSMLQGGSLLRYDLKTGSIQGMKPYLKDGRELRFNWNAGIAIDPFDQQTLYFGSQYVLKSTDKGNSWERISEDLTTNDPAKQNASTSGGLSYDATGAENHTTIITIAPSTIQKDVIWIGTDDGNIQVTQNGGGMWVNVTSNIKGVPAGSWVAQIQPSVYNAGEAFATINNYRRDDWTPYVYHTDNFGKTWNRLVDATDVPSYCLSFVQDPVVPELMFLGTEFGLYYSTDKGDKWNKWTNGYPSVSTMDMEIHPREHDLVLGTFGRSIWVLDDIRPLRKIATAGRTIVENGGLHLFEMPTAYIANLGEPNGYRSTGNGIFMGENRMQGALMSVYVPEVKEGSKEKLIIKVIDSSGDTIRTFNSTPHKGINRLSWDLDKKGFRLPNQVKPKEARERGGRGVLPGTYKVMVSYNGQTSQSAVDVVVNPSEPITTAEMKKKADALDRYESIVTPVTERMDQLRDAKQSIELIKSRLSSVADTAQVSLIKKSSKEQLDQIDAIFERFSGPKDIQGIYRDPNLIDLKIGGVRRALQGVLFTLTDAQIYQIDQLEKDLMPEIKRIDDYLKGDWITYRKMVEESAISLF